MQRRHLWVHAPIQRRYVFLVLTFSVPLALVVAWIVYHLVWAQVANEPMMAAGAQPFVSLFETMDQTLLTPLAVALVLLIVSVLMVGVVVSHQIGGPIWRFKQICRRLREGDYSVRAKLRKRDSLHDLAEDLNAALEAIEEERRKLVTIIADQSAAINDAYHRAANDPVDVDELRHHLHSAHERIEEWDAMASHTSNAKNPRPTAGSL